MTENHPTGSGRWRHSKSGLALLAFAAIATFFLVTEYRAHVFGALPFVLVLLCLLLHLFGHGGNGDHPHREKRDQRE